MDYDTDKIIKLLSSSNIFQNLDSIVIADIVKHTQIERFAKDQVMIGHGESGKRLYFIAEGEVEVQVPDVHGKIRKRLLLRAGEVVGEISLLVQSTYSANIVARADTIVFYLDGAHFMSLIRKSPEFSDVMSDLMADRMAQNRGLNQVGKYQLLGKLGEGGMATVFRGYDKDLNREVALKMLKYQLACNPRFLDRFELEAKIIASLTHPNIVNVIEVIDQFSTRFIVMEKLQGFTLADILLQEGAFSLEEARRILSQVASALQYAHQYGENGIVHKDVKPSNIIVDRFGNVSLTDFGIASPPSKKEDIKLGTLSYLAPEILSGDDFDYRADIYSFGVLAYKMLCDRLPYVASTPAELIKLHDQQGMPDIRIACLGIDHEFACLIEKSLAKDPAKRIADWNEIRDILSASPSKKTIHLDSEELGVFIKFRDTSMKESAKHINSIQKMLRDQNVNHSIETHWGRDMGDSG